MDSESQGQMQWRSSTINGPKSLYLRRNSYEPWLPYTCFPMMAVPDPTFATGAQHSKGWATYQKLLKAGWKLIASEGSESWKN